MSKPLQNRMDAPEWFANGYTSLVSIVPPHATLSPTSGLAAAARGKVPGVLRQDGTWTGYNWRDTMPEEETVRRWALAGSNIGLNTTFFPAIDIDCLDADFAADVQRLAFEILGPAPIRVGRAPKRLLLYRLTGDPFPKAKLALRDPQNTTHLIEVLGQGQQCVILGTHPATNAAYTWDEFHTATALTPISASDVRLFLSEVQERATLRGYRARQTGAGAAVTPDELSLRAPSYATLRDIVSAIPNTDFLFPTRDSYLEMGYAIKASVAPEQEDDAYSLFAEWASKWDGNARFAKNDPETVRDDWRRMVPPYRVGWRWLSEKAKQHGYQEAQDDFDPTDDTPPPMPTRPDSRASIEPIFGTDAWLAERMIGALGDGVRYAPEARKWYVWDGTTWAPGAILQAEARVNQQLIEEADRVSRMGATDDEKKFFYKKAETFLSTKRARDVRSAMESHPSLAIRVTSFDSDPWALNTPSGIVNLKKGALGSPNATALCSRSTLVPPDFGGACPTWVRFLYQTVGGDQQMVDYLQRLCGYCLTGTTYEQQLSFIWGPGGNGKSVFLNVLNEIMASYAMTAPTEVFTATKFDRHSTEVAMLAGARLVTASEIDYGRTWNVARLKSLSGGEPISARFMRQDNFVFTPTFKLLIAGNAKPRFPVVDDAMERRLHLVPFTRKPVTVDSRLGDKLRDEYPAILAWMIEGCLKWQQSGLVKPDVVKAATTLYFAESGMVRTWLDQFVMPSHKGFLETRAAYVTFNTWCKAAGELPIPEREFVGMMEHYGHPRVREAQSPRRYGFVGIELVQETLADLL